MDIIISQNGKDAKRITSTSFGIQLHQLLARN
jgi:hypothetical protein